MAGMVAMIQAVERMSDKEFLLHMGLRHPTLALATRNEHNQDHRLHPTRLHEHEHEAA